GPAGRLPDLRRRPRQHLTEILQRSAGPVDTVSVESMFPFVFGVFFLGVVVMAYLGWKKQQARIAEIQQLCLARGWSYTGEAPRLTTAWQGAPFGEGESRRARNVVAGQWGRQAFTSFDYTYVTETHDSEGRTHRTTHTYGVVALALPAYLPTLQVTGESVLR